MAGLPSDAVLRANPDYELVLFDRLSNAERAMVPISEQSDADLYGILRPRPGSGLHPRAVSQDTALLYLTLSRPGRLPAYAARSLGGRTDTVVARLVLDSVLEVRHRAVFVSGTAAAGVALPDAGSGGRGRIGELSIAALRYAQQFAYLPTGALGRRLYEFGRQPCTPGLLAQHAHEQPGEGGAGPTLADGGWTPMPSGPEVRRHWHRWWAPSASRAGRGSITEAGFKLYVSPDAADVHSVLPVVADVLTERPGGLAIKVGNGIDGICRPDKIVAYFGRLDDLEAAVAALSARLAGVPAQGVPFTAAITDDGLLSWGADPPGRASIGVDGTSWRAWVTARLAEYLVQDLADGRRATSADDDGGWRHALQRLRLIGIDTDTWVPVSRMWPETLEQA